MVDFSEGFPYLPRIRLFKEYFRTRVPHILPKDLDTTPAVSVDFEDFVAEITALDPEGPAIALDIFEQPSVVLRCISLSLYQVLRDTQGDPLSGAVSPGVPKVTVRLHNYGPFTSLRSLKAASIGRHIRMSQVNYGFCPVCS